MSLEGAFEEAALLFAAGKYEEAVQAYSAIHDPSAAVLTRALNNMSACYAALKDYPKSIEKAEQVLALQPGNAKAHGRIAAAEEALKRYDAAFLSYTKAGLLEWKNKIYTAGAERCLTQMQANSGVTPTEKRDAYYYEKSLERAMAAMREANYPEAIRHFGKSLSLFPSSGTSREKATLLSNRSAAYFRADRIEESAEDAREATKADVTYARGFFRLGAAMARLKKFGEAHEALIVCLQLDPGHAEGIKLLAEVLPAAKELLKTPEEKARAHAAHVADVEEQLAARQATATANTTARAPARGSGYAYCSYCNESGHSRGECPLLRRKRSRHT